MRKFFSKTKWGIFHPGPVLPPSGEDSPFLTSVELFDGTLRAADESFPTSSDWAPFWRRSQSPETFLICFKFDSKFCYWKVSRSPRLRGSFDAECLFEKSPEQPKVRNMSTPRRCFRDCCRLPFEIRNNKTKFRSRIGDAQSFLSDTNHGRRSFPTPGPPEFFFTKDE